MHDLRVKIKKLNPAAKIPAYQTDGAAGCDLCAAEGPVTLLPGERALIPTGIALDFGGDGIPAAALIFARSGLATKYGVCLSNGVGVVDADYRGEIKVGLVNTGTDPFTVHPGDRVAQMVFVPVFRARFEEAEALGETDRGEGGFGHTGV